MKLTLSKEIGEGGLVWKMISKSAKKLSINSFSSSFSSPIFIVLGKIRYPTQNFSIYQLINIIYYKILFL